MANKSTDNAGFVAALKREWLHYKRCSGEVFFSLITLILSMVVVTWIFSSGVLRDIPIAVVNNDGSSVSRAYIRMLDASPQLRIAETMASSTQARALLDTAAVYAVVVIPKDFSQSLKLGRQTTVFAWHSAQFLTVSGVISKSLREVTGTMSAAIKISSLQERGESSIEAKVNFSPVQAELRTLFNPFQNYQYFLIAGLLPAMLQVFVMIWSVYLVGKEYQDNTSAQWLATGHNIYNALLAKVLPLFLLSSVIGLACLLYLFGIAGWPINGSLSLLIIAWEFMIAAYIVLGLLFAAFAPQLATGLSVAVFFTAPAFAYAGVTFPQQSMPLLAELWAYLLPVRSLLRLQIEQTELGTSVQHSLPELLILLSFVLLPLPFAIKRLKLRCETS
ncbi:ABC transporter permease [Colwellia sp. Arc7-635]|uniref:ABC transporter permease n=1 Tax=Colwellia sp. Arc7-635 TaxID=2497879 RepID=UPI000F855D20|nr:ABC transporter permease [Colwellia sp. Arc7-635]AZQ84384.1 ABC transporter permease [Colwellia sp. Arc7-635]